MRVGLVGWPLTHPAPPLRGYVVSDVLHRVDDARLALEGADAVAADRMWAPIAAARSVRLDPDPHDVLAKADALPHASDVDVRADPAPVQADSLHLRIFEVLEASARTSRFVAVRLPGLDAVAHYYLRYADAGGVRRRHRRRARGASAACSTTTTACSTRWSGGSTTRSAPTTSCSWCRATAWSRSRR